MNSLLYLENSSSEFQVTITALLPFHQLLKMFKKINKNLIIFAFMHDYF